MGQTVVLRCKIDDDGTTTKREVRLPEPFIIGSSVQVAIGEKEARSVAASREGRGSRYLLRTSSRSIVDKLTKLTELIDGTQIEIFLHPTLNTVQGLVFEPDSIDTDEKVIEKNLRSEGVQAVRRIKKRVNGKLQNTPLLVLSFSGTVLPSYVFFGLLRISVKQYYPSPMLCFKCGMYGHSQKMCQQPGICLRCSQPLHVADGEQCNNTPYCFHCKNGHSVKSRDCAKFKEEDKIVHLKVDQGISYTEARRRYNDDNKRETIARIIQDQLKQEIATKDQLIASLQQQVATLAKELESQKSSLNLRTPCLSPAASNVQRSSKHHSSQKPPATTTQSIPTTKHAETRESRKDGAFLEPPLDKADHIRVLRSGIVRSRSRSGKRQSETSPHDTNSSRGKRSLTQPTASQNTIDIDE
ncbi:uncharacterized protein LOC134286366 [Aedes albopictus]|uniref:CCHC-type domain-containing protein n=1 Tax=Aedes albopictus TaxID=7160 RepID=A0ABM1XN84_AEDAL